MENFYHEEDENKYVVYPLFSSPIFESFLPEIKEKEKDFLFNSEFERMPSGTGYHTVNKYILNSHELIGLKNSIYKYFDLYVRKVLSVTNDINFKLTTSWVVKLSPGDYGDVHHHGNSVLSGILYLNTISKDCGQLIFIKNSNFTTIFPQTIVMNYNEPNMYNADSFGVMPIDKKIIFFPSCLSHRITKNLSNEDRYSLAFNFFPIGKFGSSESELFIN